MPETTNRPDGDDMLAALLYATGDLDGEAALAFERRLADDQAAREALCEAVRLSRSLTGQPAPVPNPAYRESVCRHLCGTGVWHWLAGRKNYRGHPALWAVAGAAAAALFLTISWEPLPSPAVEAPAPVLAQEKPAPAPVADAAGPPAGVAEVWAELSNARHLERALKEENRRKVRAEDRRIVRLEDRSSRLTKPQVANP